MKKSQRIERCLRIEGPYMEFWSRTWRYTVRLIEILSLKPINNPSYLLQIHGSLYYILIQDWNRKSTVLKNHFRWMFDLHFHHKNIICICSFLSHWQSLTVTINMFLRINHNFSLHCGNTYCIFEMLWSFCDFIYRASSDCCHTICSLPSPLMSIH